MAPSSSDSATATTVAVQGELGSNSELAAHEFFGDGPLEIVACPTFTALFDAVGQGRARFGMAPVENSLAGSVHPVWDLLAERRLPVAGEILLRISHCLISHPGAGLGDIADVYSHPQALAQCERYLNSLEGVRQHEVYDTAGAVKMIAERGVRGEAAIASAQAAADYDMLIVAADIETQHENYTRFLILSAEPVEPPAEDAGPVRTTVVAELGDRARRLPELLAPLAGRGIEILKVECTKRLGQPWTYVAYLDLAANSADPAVESALAEMAGVAARLQVVGPYPAGRRAEPRFHTR